LNEWAACSNDPHKQAEIAVLLRLPRWYIDLLASF